MKKKILIVSIIVVLLTTVTIILLILKPWTSNYIKVGTQGVVYEDITASEAMLKVYRNDDIKQIEQHYNLKATKFEDKYYFDNIECFGQKMNFSYLFDSNNYLLESNVYGNFSVDKNNVMSKSLELVNNFSAFFGVDNPSSYYIYTNSSALDISQEDSYHMIFDGLAILEFRVRDLQDSFWILKIQSVNSENILSTIEHYVGNVQYGDIIANLDLT